MNTFLLELGTEELPPKLLTDLSHQLAHHLTSLLSDNEISFNDVKLFATPRRLAILIKGLPNKQVAKQISKKGPVIDAPDKAIAGFMQSVGVKTQHKLSIKKIGKKKYYFYQFTQNEKLVIDILPSLIPEAILNIAIARTMRWSQQNFSFIRPIQWLVALLNDAIIPTQIFDIKSDRITHGLRFAKINQASISSASDYELTLSKLHIIADFNQRKEVIKTQINALANQHKVCVDIPDGLLNEVCALVEAPCAFFGHFPNEFLALPEEVLVLTMESHQKYFSIKNNSDDLMPAFISVANLTDNNQNLALVITGNERVIYPRLADAQFFYQQDIQHTLENRLKQLKTVVFMQDIGSLFDKVVRLEKMAKYFSNDIGLNTQQQQTLQRAALLSKSDLVSNMVIELPKLQGVMGGYYAQVDKEDIEVSKAISQQYYPRFSGDNLPHSQLGCYLSLLDKIDTIIGVFVIGKIATGSKDPYALRRLALGIVRIILEQEIRIKLLDIIRFNLAQYSINKNSELADKILNFIFERLKVYYIGQNISNDIYNAIATNKTDNLLDFDQRLKALNNLIQQPEIKNLIILNKRILNTLKTHQNLDTQVEVSLFVTDEEKLLFNLLLSIEENKSNNYPQKLDLFCTNLEPAINTFFEQVMVNDDNQKIAQNRLNLLNKVRQLLLSVADLSCLN